MSQNGKHCLVFGASGISGWALLNASVNYPSPTTFHRITGLCNRPLTKEAAYLPADPRINLVSGIDLTGSVESVVKALKEKVEQVETVSIVYFCAYIQTGDFQSLREVNTELIRVAITAIDEVAPNLETVILQTGGKSYGVEFPDKVTISAPLKEDAPRIPEPWASNIFYYSQHDVLKELSQGKKWTFSEIRPDAIVGFVPGRNVMNVVQGVAFYLTLQREVNGPGATVPFPGTEKSYRATHTDTFQDILAKMEIYVSLNRDKCPNASIFNITDGEVVTWADVWPGLCSYFGLKGSGPTENTTPVEEFVEKNKSAWQNLVQKHGLKTGYLEITNWKFVAFLIEAGDFNREYSIDKARSIGFEESIPTVKGYTTSFDRMRAAKILPPI
ncbi:hypothetical protein DTO166G4_1778 [Paecilomyces variotii]|nr:hypothetical protein DTO166G4_1778 [Paecilomyces variotii]KAJ9223282.1 hypothetical protein DTO169C6_4328 [Paecilomyces variotii]KAJ9239534.1 hypothetical protein DTO166G5_2281 [Paecilomyces variotii]